MKPVPAQSSTTRHSPLATRHVLFIAGEETHPPGTHEAMATLRLLAHCMQESEDLPPLRTLVLEEWPTGKNDEFERTLAEADSVVFLGDLFPLLKLPESGQSAAHAQLDRAIRNGLSLVCLHYANATRGPHPLLEWAGGYWVMRTARTDGNCETDIHRTTPNHPVSRGWDTFHVRDEIYYGFQFGDGGIEAAVMRGVTPILHAMLPQDAPNKEVVGWAFERGDGGRAFMAYVTHYFENWKIDPLRTMTLNGIAWASGLDIPPHGVRIRLPHDLSVFSPKTAQPNSQGGLRPQSWSSVIGDQRH